MSLLFVILLLPVSEVVWAQSPSLDLSLRTGITAISEDLSVEQDTGLTMNFFSPLWQDLHLELSGTANYGLDYLPEFSQDISFSLARAVLRYNEWTVGRQLVMDASSLIIAHPLDGIRYDTQTERATMHAGLYTQALIPASNSGIVLSALDIARLTSDDDTLLSAPRAILGLGYRTQGTNWVGAELWGQLDGRRFGSRDDELVLRPGDERRLDLEEGVSEGTLVDSLYPSVSGSYLINDLWRVTAYVVGMIGSDTREAFLEGDDDLEPDLIIAGAGLLRVSRPIGPWSAEFQMDVVSGKRDMTSFRDQLSGNGFGLNTLYRSISAQGRGSLLGLEIGNTATATVRLAGNPFLDSPNYHLRFLTLIFEVLSLHRLSVGPNNLDQEVIDVDSLSPNLGTEMKASALWQIRSDLRLNADLTVFVPGEAVLSTFADGAFATARLGIGATLQF